MANVTNLRNGSTGSEVKKLQQALIDAGYDVGKSGADGVLGNNTEAAIRKYQKDNGLTVDGIAGKNTQGLLYGTNTSKTGSNTGGTNAAKTTGTNAGSTNKTNTTKASDVSDTALATTVTSPAGFTYGDFSYAAFDPTADATIQQANTLLNQNLANKPGSYTPVWQDEADAYLSQYQNREDFSYDFNTDALYNMYKDQYIQQGQMAMMDTMGQAAAMTGGYGNSYAQTAGQQAYNQQLGQLNEIMPELYSMAYDRYNQEGQDLLTQYSLYMDRENQEYSKYQDTLNNWYRENALLTDNYNTAYKRAYDKYLLGYNTALDEYNTDRSEEFTKWQTQQNQEFTASENEKDRLHSASENEKSREFTASENDKDRQHTATENEKSRNFTADENSKNRNADLTAASIKAAGELKNTMPRADQELYRKDADRAVAEGKGIDALYEIGETLENEGYSEDFIEKWIASEIKRLFPVEQQISGGIISGIGSAISGALGTMYSQLK